MVKHMSHWPRSSADFNNEYLRVAALPDLVRTDLDSLKISDQKERSGGQFLDRHFSVLSSICRNHCLGVVRMYNMTKLEYNMAKKNALEMKLSCLRQEILAQTYTPEVKTH